jgi:hypothetical protein
MSYKFPNVSDTKIKEDIFIGFRIRELMQDKQLDENLNETERNAWLSFKRICKYFLQNHIAVNYQDVVQDLLTLYKAIECNMSISCILAALQGTIILNLYRLLDVDWVQLVLKHYNCIALFLSYN